MNSQDKMRPKAALFDLDGVLTETAKIHAAAWKQMFDEFLKGYYARSGKPFIPFGQEDYIKFVDGEPRYKGAQDFLRSRNIHLPFGKPSDLSDKTVCGLGNRKNKLYVAMIQKTKPFVYKTDVAFLKKLKKEGLRIGLISSSKNARRVLNSCGLTHLFETIVDGNTLEKAGLSGKPSPDMFIYAAKNIDSSPGETMIFEDAVSGVEAGTSGNFGLVVGILRNRSNDLKKADMVVDDLKELSVQDVKKWFEKGMDDSEWKLEYLDYAPQAETLREDLTSTGNGYLCTRGCYETQTSSAYHYPGFYMAGIYNPLTTMIGRKKTTENSIVNLPNWLLVKIKIDNEIVDPFESEIIDYRKSLNMREAVLTNCVTFKDFRGRITKIEIKRFTSMENPHIASLRFSIIPMNYSGRITLCSSIDGDVENANVERYRGLKSRHLKILRAGKSGRNMILHAKTINSHYEISLAVKNRLNVKGVAKKISHEEDSVCEELSFNAKEKDSYVLEKTMSVFTSRESKNPIDDSKKLLDKVSGFDDLFARHKTSWRELWERAGILLEGDRFSQKVLRLHAYHLLSSYSPHVKGLDVGIPARGLNGEAYRGHIFWDEIYILPFYMHRFPDIARAHLMYRYNRLGEAKQLAKKYGFKGAVYPQQSADTGKEESPDIHYNPRDKTWGPDLSRYQRHVSIAVFYDFYKYINHTIRERFFLDYGAEVMVEIARFWADIAKYSPKDKKYHIDGVMGPDEFHEEYPHAKKPGLNDNAYTNVMASWLLNKMVRLSKDLPREIVKKLGLNESEINKWEDISKNMYVPVKNGLILQFEGYDRLKELDWDHYKKKYKNISRIDRILKAEGKSPNDYKVVKQADTLMIFYLLDFQEAINLLRKLGVKIKDPKAFFKRNYDYYFSRTTHGSNLSRFVHGAISIDLGHRETQIWKLFSSSLKLDIYDTQHGTTHEGIHMGLMAGTINVLRKYIAGIRTHPKGLSIFPWIPKQWRKIQFRITHQKSWYDFLFDLGGKKALDVTLESGDKKSLVEYRRKKIILTKGRPKELRLN